MKVHITNIHGVKGIGAKAQHAVADIAKRYLQYKELGIYLYPIDSDSKEMLRTRLEGILASVCDGDVVIMQSPTWNEIRFDEALMDKLCAYHDVKKIIFIHDVLPLLYRSWVIPMSRWIEFYNRADLLVVPSQNMADFLCAKGLNVKNIVIQKMFDCRVSVDETAKPQFRKVINFAGNPNTERKLAFARDWNYDAVQLAVTVNNGDWAQGKNICFLGWFNNDNLLAEALRKSGGFGLLWSEDPNFCEYMKMNAPYKLSTYLGAGIPVIVPSYIPERDTVIRKNLGLVVDSLDEAVERVNGMREEEYAKMVEDAGLFSHLLRDGYFTKKALTDAVFKVLETQVLH